MAGGHTDDTFLTEQLQRIRGLSERITEARERVVESRQELEREMDLMRAGPLEQVRDYRTHGSQRSERDDSRAHAADSSRESSRHRRRR